MLKEVKALFTAELCNDLGVQLLAAHSDRLIIGAMNTNYYKLCDFIEELKENHSIDVSVQGISSEEWERWHDNGNQLTATLQIPEQGYDSSESLLSSELQSKTVLNKAIDPPSVQVQDAPLGDLLNDGTKSNLNGRFDEDKTIETMSDPSSQIYDADLLQIGFNLDDIQEQFEENVTDEDVSQTIDSSDFVVKMCSVILMYCYACGGSDIHVEPQKDHLRIRYRIDGKLKSKYSIPKNSASSIVSRLKVLAKLDVAEKRLPQDGRIRLKHNDVNIDFRVSTLPGKLGEKVVLRILRSDSSVLKLDKLITMPNELDTVRRLCSSSYGIFIVVGPTGSGKSTTLYSVLAENNDPEVNITTVEDPVEYTLPGIHQVQVLREKGYDFARALRALMRQDPDIILVGETRDKETAQVAMEAALTGHMVFTTLHANDTATAVTRLLEMKIPAYLIGSSLVGLCAQRLVRKVCKKCAKVCSAEKNEILTQYGISDHLVANIDSSSSQKCSECDGTGYKGRIGLYEVLEITDEIRESILDGSNSEQIRDRSISIGMKTLTHYGMMLVKNHDTTLEEIERVCLVDQTIDEIENEIKEEHKKMSMNLSLDSQANAFQ